MSKRDKILFVLLIVIVSFGLFLLLFTVPLEKYMEAKKNEPVKTIEEVEIKLENEKEIEEPVLETEIPVLEITSEESEINVTEIIDSEPEIEVEELVEVFPDIRYVKLGTGFFTDDLDGDGIEENWNLFGNYYDDVYELTLIINQQNVTEPIWGFYSDEVAIVQFPNDSKKYIFVSDYGPSNDYVTTVYSYDKDKGAHVDIVEGIIINGSLTVNGDKTIVSQQRANLLQTWWYYVTYDLTNEGLVKREQDFYDAVEVPGLNWGSEITMDFDFYTKPDLNSEKVTLPKGAYVFFTRLDDEHWVEIEYDKWDEKQTAYLYIENFGTVDSKNGIDATMLFNNLLLAD